MKKTTRKKIYLAGGFISRWQQIATSALTGYDMFDPSAHNIKGPKDYTAWDLEAIRNCDILLANMESTNPGGYALALEIGYAKALGKPVVLVDQLTDIQVIKYFEMVRCSSDIIFDNLPEALDYINKTY